MDYQKISNKQFEEISSSEDGCDTLVGNLTDSGDEKTFHFYLIINKTDYNTKFELKFKNMYQFRKAIMMDRRDDNIFHTQITIKNSDLNELNEIRYSYIKQAVGETLDTSEESEQERTKAKKFFKLNSFFDIFSTKKQFLATNPKSEYQELLIKFFIRNYNIQEQHFGRPCIFQEYQDFLKEEGNNFPYSPTFRLLHQEYMFKYNDSNFNLYLIEVLSFFDTKILKRKNKYIEPLTKEMHKQSFGYFRKLLPEENLSESYIRGIRTLIDLNPLIGIEFFNDSHIISNPDHYLRTLNLKDDINFNYFKSAIKLSYTDLSFSKQNLQKLINNAFLESRTLDVFLNTVEDLQIYSDPDSLIQCTKSVKNRFSDKQVKDFIRFNLDRILSVLELKIVFRKDVKDQIFVNLKSNPHHPGSFYQLHNNPDLISMKYLDKLVYLQNNSFLQKEFKKLVLIFLKNVPRLPEFHNLRLTIGYNFYNLIQNQQNLSQQYLILSDFIDLIQDPIFEKIKKFNQQEILLQFRHHMIVICQQHQLQWLLESLVDIQTNEQDQQFKVDQLIEVILEIIKSVPITEQLIYNIFNLLFGNYNILFDSFKPIADIAFKNLQQLKKNHSNLYEDDLILISLRISQNYSGSEYLDQLQNEVKNFIKRMKDKSIMLKEINSIIVNRKKNLEVILKLIEPDFDLRILQDLSNINNFFQEQVNKHQNFVNWASKSNMNIAIKKYELEINKIIQNQETLTAQKASSTDLWVHFQMFSTIEQYYHFRSSELFNNLFRNLSEEAQKQGYIFEESKQNIDQGIQYISMSQFDKVSQDLLLGIICLYHFNSLLKYPNTSISYETLKKYWFNIRPQDVKRELQYVQDYQQNLFHNKDLQMPEQVLDHLQKFGNLEIYYSRAMILISLEIYAKHQKFLDIQKDEIFLKLKKYTEFVNEYSQDTNLQVIALEVSKIEGIFTELNQNQKIKWSMLEDLSRSKDTFEFSIENIGLNFNDLYEHLDEFSYLTNATISDMNSVSNFFNNFYQNLQSQFDFNSFFELLEYFTVSLEKEIFNDRDFPKKLIQCNQNLSAIKQIADSSKNVAENTLQIIDDSLNYGIIVWTKQNDKFDFKLKVIYPHQKHFTFEERKSMSQSILSQNQRTVTYDNDKVNQHCSRAILLIHSRKTNPAQQQVTEQNVNKFATLVSLSSEINNLLKDLSAYGKLKYTNADRKDLPINKETLQNDLQNLQKQLINELNEWKDQLFQLRQKYYFLTYVPNQMIARLIEMSESKNVNLYEKTLKKLRKYKILKDGFGQGEEFSINNLSEENIFEQLQSQWLIGQQKYEESSVSRIEKQFTQFSLQFGKTQFKYVPEDLSLIKAIISIFMISSQLPIWSDILFATEDTKINEIETFVLRAMMSPLKQKMSKVFCITNFQKLPFTIQNHCYEFIKLQEKSYHKYNFCLYVISVCKDIKQARLIEELRSSQLFQQYILEEHLRDFFRKFDFIRVIKSEFCGLGKSEHIRNQITKAGRQVLRLPIYGELSRQKLINLHKKRMRAVNQPFYIHYDIYPTTKEELNVVMFEILILGCLNDSSTKMFHLPENIKVFIEISQSLNEDFTQFFFTYMKNVDLKWDFTNIRVHYDVNDKLQKVCRYIHALEEASSYKIETLINPKQPLTEFECQMLLKKHIVCKLKHPNFYYINSYVDFVSDQIRRMEESPFFTQENLERQMSGFFGSRQKAQDLHKEIVKQLTSLSLKISIVEKSQENIDMNGEIQKKSLTEKQAERFKDFTWDVFNNSFIVFNDSGTITPIFKNHDDVPKAIQDYHKRANKKDKEAQVIKLYDQMTQDEYIEKILEICVDEAQKERLRKSKDLKTLVFTLDNFIKLVLIYLRIRAFQPIILMGETGVGKTSLVEYLAKVINAEFIVLNVHAGISEQRIIDFVEAAQEKARNEEVRAGQKRKVILFFDEINTNVNISGLLKEIFIDRHINGCPLEKNICLVSACNPFKMLPKETSALTTGLKYSNKDNSLSKLVYKVLPLPESLIPFIWDYKSLDKSEEIKYIKKMVEKTFEQGQIFGTNINLIHLWSGNKNHQQTEQIKIENMQKEIEQIATVIQLCQNRINSLEECNWAVSLRDVSRFCKLFIYFFNNNVTRDKDKRYRKQSFRFRSKQIALVLSIYFCYIIRLKDQEKRLGLIKLFSQEGQKLKIDALLEQNFEDIVKQEQNRFLDKMEIKQGIGKSVTLKENIFVIITCILNQIPLIITGKPGSSKTLAMNLINKSFRGNISNNPFFKNFPAILPFFYQGSEQSTSNGILRIYKKAHKTQKKVHGRKEQVVVIFDEIGLAENSPHNPLKVLHSLLEPPKVATVGISNWALDASKMNRVITLSRTDPDQKDLYDTALSIARDSHEVFRQKYLKQLVDWYYSYIERQESNIKTKSFHGLRDFYSMIKYISSRISEDENQNAEIILNGIQRNFGGKNFETIKQTLEKRLQLKSWDSLKKTKPDELIKQNLTDYNSRHLMVITDNFENTLQFLQDECQQKKTQYEIFYGSDFPDDQNEESIYKQINEIILQMENGTLCIFLNLKNIYQSFYDMLNQNYQEIGNQRFCKVAIGPDSSRCLVHENFKCVLIVDINKVDDLDPPLLNRFEKQLFTEEVSIDPTQKSIINKLNTWCNQLCNVANFTKKSMFPTVDETQSLQQLVIQNKDLYGNEEEIITEKCKKSLIRVATFQGIIRSELSKAIDRQRWYDEYMNKKSHYNLHSLLMHYIKNWKSKKCFEKTKGFNLLVYTFQAIISQIKPLEDVTMQEKISLSSIHRKKQFQEKIEEFFSNSNPNQLLLIYADLLNDSKNRINLCRSIINNQRTKRVLNNELKNMNIEELKDKHICFIIRIDSTREDQCISFGKDWRQYTVDLLNGKGHSEISMNKLVKNDLETLISLACSQQSLFQVSLVESMSKIYYNRVQKFIAERIQQIQDLFKNPENIQYLKDLILLKIKQDLDFQSKNQGWKINVVTDEFLMKSNLTFHSASLEFIKTEMVKFLAFIIFYMEQDGIINAATNETLFTLAKFYFRNLYENNYLTKGNQDMYFLAQNFDRIKFPLARLIHQQFQQLKIQYTKILKEQQDVKEVQEPDDEDNSEAIFVSQIVLEEELERTNPKQKSLKKQEIERANIAKMKKFIFQDKQLIQNITDLEQWCKIYFPQDYIDQKILSIDNHRYIEDFSYLIDSQGESVSNNGDYSEVYNKFIIVSLSLIMKEKYESKSQIYGVYWKYENALQNIWKIIKENIRLFDSKTIMEKLEKEIRNHDLYSKSDLNYLPRESYVECVIKVFYELYYPTDNLRGKFDMWEQNVKSTFQKLNDLAFYYLQDFNTQQSRDIIFLLKFNHEILKDQSKDSRENIFIKFAQQIKDILTQPEQVITVLKETMKVDQEQNLRRKRSVFKFQCQYIIDSFYNDDQIDFNFLLEQIISHLIDHNDPLVEFQRDPKFNFILQKLVYITTFLLEEDCFLNVLTSNIEEYNEIINDYPNYQIFDQFIREYEKDLKLSDPLVISLSDQFEEMIDGELFQEDDLVKNKLFDIQDIILASNTNEYSLVQKILAIVVFKKIAKIYAEELSAWINGAQFEAVNLMNCFEDFFSVDSEQKRQILHPLAFYLLKLLFQKHDILNIEQSKLIEKNNWVKKYFELSKLTNKAKFSFIKDQEYIGFKEEAKQKLQNSDEITKLPQLVPMKKFSYMIAIIEEYYLQSKFMDKDQKMFSEQNQIVKDNYTKDFLMPFCTGHFELQVRNKFIKIDMPDTLYYFKILQTFLGAAALCNEQSFLYEFFTSPQKIKEYFVPFVQNIKEDSDYQTKIRNHDYLSSLTCSQCKQINLVIELSNDKLDSSKLVQLGDKHCQYCKGINELENQRKLESTKNVLINPFKFNTDIMAQKSYIPFDLQRYNDITIRNLTINELAIGRIILHSLLMLSLSFTKQDNEILGLILSDYPYSGQDYATYIKRTIQYLAQCFSMDWSMMKNRHNINDEKLLQMVEYVIIEIVKSISKFKCDQLAKPDTRKEFEKLFSDICKPIFADINLFFETKIGFESEIENYLMEQNKVEDHDLYHLLRVQNQITINQFEEYTKASQQESNFFKRLFEQKESIQNIEDLKPLTQWAKFIFNKFSAQITYDEANSQKTIKQIIDEEKSQNIGNIEYYLKIQKDFAKFQLAWNKYAGLIIRDKNVEVVVPTISEDSKLIYCCITKDKFDQQGHIFFVLLKYLAQKQNKILEEAKNLFMEDQINSISFPKTSLLNIKKDSIIYFREKQLQEIKRKQTKIQIDTNEILLSQLNEKKSKNYEKEKFEQIIIQNSSCNLKYGKGKHVEYNVEQIKNNTIELLLKGKQLIDWEDQNTRLNFQFVNIGNLYSQFETIQRKIQQDKLDRVFAHNVLQEKGIEEIHQLLGQLRTTMNFLESSEISNQDEVKQKPLLDFMKALKIVNDSQSIGQDIKVKHIISLYEYVEEKVEDIEVKKIHKDYQEPLADIQIKMLTDIAFTNRKKEELEKMMHIIGRLCIRQLRNLQKDLLEQNLFQNLAQEKNFNLYALPASNEDKNQFNEFCKKFQEFFKINIEIKQAKSTYDRFRLQYQKIIDDERAAEESERQRLLKELNEKQIADMDISKIVASETITNPESSTAKQTRNREKVQITAKTAGGRREKKGGNIR